MSGIIGTSAGERWNGVSFTGSGSIAAVAGQRIVIHSIQFSSQLKSAGGYVSVAGTVGGATVTYLYYTPRPVDSGYGSDLSSAQANSVLDLIFDTNTAITVTFSNAGSLTSIAIAYKYQ